MSDQELKPCPFCGSKNLAVTASFGAWWVTCTECHASTGRDISREKAFYRWNTRAPDPMLEELARVLGDLLFECDGVFDTCKPSRHTYNLGLASLEKYRESKVRS